MISVWERAYFYKYDYLIIGAGITGLSTAAALRKIAGPKTRIAIIEKEVIPSGASTRNAGFACFGSFTEILDDINRYGEKEALELVQNRYKGIRHLIDQFGAKDIGLVERGGYELIIEKDIKKLEKLDEVNEKLHYIFDKKVFHIRSEKITAFGFRGVKSMIHTPFEYQLNPGMLMQALQRRARRDDITTISGAEVSNVEDTGHGVTIYLYNGMTLKARKAAVCTNAFTPKLCPELDIKPGRGLILMTKPLAYLPFEGSFHFDRGYYYFRNYQNRLLFGGGRNTDRETETTDLPGVNPKILALLKEKIAEIVLPDQKFEVDTCWSGIMAFGKIKLPIVEKLSKNIAVGARLSGMGVALSGQIGQKLALLLTDQQ